MTTELLVRRANHGDVDAFTELVSQYQGRAFAYALTTLSDYQLAEDATQQALITAYRNLASLREPGSFGSWLRGIVRFECLRVLRDRSRHQNESLDAPGAVDVADPSMSVERQAEIRSDFLRLQAHMARLPDKQRVVAQLYYLGDQSQAAVAEFLGLSVSTVNNRLREARATLGHEGVYSMSNQSLNTPSFSDVIGKVLRANNQTIDAHVDSESRPPLLTSVTIGEPDRVITAFISQYLDDDVARLIVSDVEPDRIAVENGSVVSSQGKVTDSHVTDDIIARLAKQSRLSTRPTASPSGIKVIDLFSPLVHGGVVALVGARNVGKMVLLEELAFRLAGEGHPVTILVFLTSPDELGAAPKLDMQTDGPVTAMMVPVADASPQALATSLDRFDTVIAMSSDLAGEGYYPAIDPLVSRSIAVQASPTARRALDLLSSQPGSDRSHLLRAYLTQPFFVAEPFTGKPGITVTHEKAESDLLRILDGDVANLTIEALMMDGSLGE